MNMRPRHKHVSGLKPFVWLLIRRLFMKDDQRSQTSALAARSSFMSVYNGLAQTYLRVILIEFWVLVPF
jgi:hypothetical protein